MMRHNVVLEHDASTGHYTATVPGMPAIVVDARSEAEAIRLAREAIAWTLETTKPLAAKVVSVDV
jgi:predicted RNase H-like HicB family nuclease